MPPPRKPNQRPRSITENDVIPPFCNSKFENCSGNQGHDGHHDHLGKKGKKWKKNSSRDKSLWGNQVSNGKKLRIKRNNKKVQFKRNDKKVFIKRNTKKRSLRINRRVNRRG